MEMERGRVKEGAGVAKADDWSFGELVDAIPPTSGAGMAAQVALAAMAAGVLSAFSRRQGAASRDAGVGEVERVDTRGINMQGR